MPAFKDHPAKDISSVLVVGESGTGKTTLAATLANAGYKVFIIDFDNKLAVLRKHLTDEGATNVRYMTLKDTGRANAFKRFRSVLANGWKELDDEGNLIEDFGKIESWGADTVLFIDSITFAGEAAKHDALALSGKKASDRLEFKEWGDARAYMESTFDRLTADNIKCNVIVTALPIAVDDDSGISHMHPLCVTKNLSLVLPKYFDNVVRMVVKAKGTHKIKTTGDNRYSLRTAATLPDEMDADAAALLKGLQIKEEPKKK